MSKLELPKRRPIEAPNTSLLFPVICEQLILPEYIDSYGHVNNSVFPMLFESARNEYGKVVLDMSAKQLAEKYKVIPSFTDHEGSLRAQIFSGDNVKIYTGALTERSSLVFAQTMYRGDDLAAFLLCRIIMIGENGRPTRVDEEIIRRIREANRSHQVRQGLMIQT